MAAALNPQTPHTTGEGADRRRRPRGAGRGAGHQPRRPAL